MNELLTLFLNDLHPILIHFPMALLTVSVGLDLLSPLKPGWRPAGWITLLIGTIGAFGATATGIITTQPYEGTPLEALIDPHQMLAFATTLSFIGLTIWRGLSLRKGADIASSRLYMILSILGVILLIATGLTGGNLVYEYGIGVK